MDIVHQLEGQSTIWGITLCKKESQVKSEKTAFSQEKSTKCQYFLTFPWHFVDFSWLKAIYSDFTWLSFLQRITTELAIQAGEGKKKVKIPKSYAKFHHLFSEEASHWFPPKQSWDHAIDFKPEAPVMSGQLL